MKITFKKEKKETGLASVGHLYPDTEIKVSGLVVGHIVAPNWRTKTNLWTVRLAKVQEPTQFNPAPFKWVGFAKKFDTEPEARIYIKGGVLERVDFEIYQFPND